MRELNRMEYWNNVFELECASVQLALHEKVVLTRIGHIRRSACHWAIATALVAPRLSLLYYIPCLLVSGPSV